MTDYNELADRISALRGRRRINPAHRYLIQRNRDRKYVGSTDDLGAVIPSAHCLVDTIGEDGLGEGIPAALRARSAS